ncbi:hypothetical protein AYO21_11628 [Fonsecaea monophora]|uniref:Uncharacterized protein n=1 Tax=Fonsecaea monophora TaxID=254056 RepID=A0A177ET38_9EURO|nr:hypothetical protein AYO21_11628 [Fonsecaea monophora]OAG34232.1 hypothetical protein AYO21_11628 [Fonsecaea monophora]
MDFESSENWYAQFSLPLTYYDAAQGSINIESSEDWYHQSSLPLAYYDAVQSSSDFESSENWYPQFGTSLVGYDAAQSSIDDISTSFRTPTSYETEMAATQEHMVREIFMVSPAAYNNHGRSNDEPVRCDDEDEASDHRDTSTSTPSQETYPPLERLPPYNEDGEIYCDHVSCLGKNQTFPHPYYWRRHVLGHERPHGHWLGHHKKSPKTHFCPFPECKVTNRTVTNVDEEEFIAENNDLYAVDVVKTTCRVLSTLLFSCKRHQKTGIENPSSRSPCRSDGDTNSESQATIQRFSNQLPSEYTAEAQLHSDLICPDENSAPWEAASHEAPWMHDILGQVGVLHGDSTSNVFEEVQQYNFSALFQLDQEPPKQNPLPPSNFSGNTPLVSDVSHHQSHHYSSCDTIPRSSTQNIGPSICFSFDPGDDWRNISHWRDRALTRDRVWKRRKRLRLKREATERERLKLMGQTIDPERRVESSSDPEQQQRALAPLEAPESPEKPPPITAPQNSAGILPFDDYFSRFDTPEAYSLPWGIHCQPVFDFSTHPATAANLEYELLLQNTYAGIPSYDSSNLYQWDQFTQPTWPPDHVYTYAGIPSYDSSSLYQWDQLAQPTWPADHVYVYNMQDYPIANGPRDGL